MSTSSSNIQVISLIIIFSHRCENTRASLLRPQIWLAACNIVAALYDSLEQYSVCAFLFVSWIKKAFTSEQFGISRFPLASTLYLNSCECKVCKRGGNYTFKSLVFLFYKNICALLSLFANLAFFISIILILVILLQIIH